MASEESVHCQKGEFQLQKEKFEKERSCWMHLHDQPKSQLEEDKGKISHCVDIVVGKRQIIIIRETLRYQLEASKKKEAF